METQGKRSNFTGSIGFVLAAAGSAVGLGNIWRFPYLAAKGGGGLFICLYIILALTFGFALLTTEIAIGRKTAQGPLTAYGKIHKNWRFIGFFAWLVPIIILPYYCTIGGWVLKYFAEFVIGHGTDTAADGYFTGYITSQWAPIIWMLIFLAAVAFVVYNGVNKGIENYSKVLMPILFILVIGIGFFSLTLSHTDADGVTRTGLQGLKIYLIPDFTGITVKKFFMILMDAMGQLFFSISVAMGIMVAYGSYAKKDTNLMKSINQIEFFDTLVALLAGLMIIPAVFTFIGILFLLMVIFAAVTSAVSVMEAIVSSIMDKFKFSRRKSTTIATIYSLVFGLLVCLGYNKLYFEFELPNGTVGQVLDIMDYLSNNIFMPLVALCTCILIGWVAGPKTVIDEVTRGGYKFGRRGLYIAMIKYVAPILLFILLVQSFGVF